AGGARQCAALDHDAVRRDPGAEGRGRRQDRRHRRPGGLRGHSRHRRQGRRQQPVHRGSVPARRAARSIPELLQSAGVLRAASGRARGAVVPAARDGRHHRTQRRDPARAATGAGRGQRRGQPGQQSAGLAAGGGGLHRRRAGAGEPAQPHGAGLQRAAVFAVGGEPVGRLQPRPAQAGHLRGGGASGGR
ncbi:hypothetical protein OY671_009920, partial [Metschnikowia pulcherrima]